MFKKVMIGGLIHFGGKIQKKKLKHEGDSKLSYFVRYFTLIN